MNAYFAASRLTPEEKENILSQHRELYNGYQTMLPKVPNTQPLYVQDFAKDKEGAVMSNKGVVKSYTNVGINEQVEEVCDECGAMEMDEEKEMCSECGGMMTEGECSECGWKGEVGDMEEEFDVDMEDGEDLNPAFKDGEFVGMEKPLGDMATFEEVCNECGGMMTEGECSECGWKGDMEEGYKTGHLDDIYKVSDLGNSDFDYVEGGGNDYGTFEKMHHMKSIKNEQAGYADDSETDDYIDNFQDPDNEDDGFEDIQSGESEMYEQGYTGGGNAPDMDISNIKPGYDFRTKGPEMGDGPFDQEAEDMDLDKNKEWDAYNFRSGGPDEVFPTFEGEVKEYEKMESAWSENEEEGDIDEANDISGVQGIYGDMKPAYDFDSGGPGKAGPYQRSSWGGGAEHSPKNQEEDEDAYWELDLEPDELDVDFEKFNPREKSWEEIKAHTGNWEEIDEDLKENFIHQKDKITEMFNRMKVIK